MSPEDLAGAVVASLVGALVMSELDAFAAQMEQERRMSNHARFEGTWAPHEVIPARVRRIIEGPSRAIERHAALEGHEVMA